MCVCVCVCVCVRMGTMCEGYRVLGFRDVQG